MATKTSKDQMSLFSSFNSPSANTSSNERKEQEGFGSSTDVEMKSAEPRSPLHPVEDFCYECMHPQQGTRDASFVHLTGKKKGATEWTRLCPEAVEKLKSEGFIVQLGKNRKEVIEVRENASAVIEVGEGASL